MQGGPRRGRSPITGPALLRAAQASQTPPGGGIQCPKGSKKELTSSKLSDTARRTGVPTPPGGGIQCPKGSKKELTSSKLSDTARRTGVPTLPGGGITCPEGSKLPKAHDGEVKIPAAQTAQPYPIRKKAPGSETVTVPAGGSILAYRSGLSAIPAPCGSSHKPHAWLCRGQPPQCSGLHTGAAHHQEH